jgi:hypothetical protein
MTSYPHDERCRKEQGAETGTLPNRMRLRVMADGSWEGCFEHDPQIDIDYEIRARKILGDAAFEEYRRRDEEDAARAASLPQGLDSSSTTSSKAANAMTAPELLGFIHSELVKDLPKDWTVLDVEGEVWFEDGQRNISTVYHFTGMSGDRHRFSATSVIGPMNAFGKLHEKFRPQGKEWRKLKLQFKNGDEHVVADSE